MKKTTPQESETVVTGNADLWRCLRQEVSQDGHWMTCTNAMEIPCRGVLVNVSTQAGAHVAEALAFIPDVHLSTPPGQGTTVIDDDRD